MHFKTKIMDKINVSWGWCLRVKMIQLGPKLILITLSKDICVHCLLAQLIVHPYTV